MSSKILLLVLSAALSVGCSTHRDERALQDALTEIRQAIDDYTSKEGHSPDSLQDLVSRHYIKKLPTDPFTRSSSSWVPEYEGRAIVDVHSGSERLGSNGKPYRQW